MIDKLLFFIAATMLCYFVSIVFCLLLGFIVGSAGAFQVVSASEREQSALSSLYERINASDEMRNQYVVNQVRFFVDKSYFLLHIGPTLMVCELLSPWNTLYLFAYTYPTSLLVRECVKIIVRSIKAA